MGAFAAGRVDVLVATTVIEVGIDVPNASVMVVEHAERFGLSQLHQLRGRVGRGAARSYCLLVAEEVKGERVRERLRVMEATTDGFRIAEEDLRIRGPGEILGTRQSGHPDLLFGNLARDRALLAQARGDAFALIEADPHLQAPGHHRARIEVVARWGGRISVGAGGLKGAARRESGRRDHLSRLRASPGPGHRVRRRGRRFPSVLVQLPATSFRPPRSPASSSRRGGPLGADPGPGRQRPRRLVRPRPRRGPIRRPRGCSATGESASRRPARPLATRRPRARVRPPRRRDWAPQLRGPAPGGRASRSTARFQRLRGREGHHAPTRSSTAAPAAAASSRCSTTAPPSPRSPAGAGERFDARRAPVSRKAPGSGAYVRASDPGLRRRRRGLPRRGDERPWCCSAALAGDLGVGEVLVKQRGDLPHRGSFKDLGRRRSW